ncbi:MAG: hypothetical protein FADNKDHG_01502 [Holosporales bacterium]
MKKPVLYLFLSVLMAPLYAQKQTLFLNDEKTLKAFASKEGITRLSIQGDRIKDIMGMDENIALEKDEQNGILFLKGVEQKQSLALLSENGLYQEIELEPTTKKSTQIVLKTRDFDIEQEAGVSKIEGRKNQIIDSTSPSFQKQVIHMIQRLYHLQRSDTDIDPIPLQNIPHIKAEAIKSDQDGHLVGFVYVLKNTSKHELLIQESDFAQKNTCAIALLSNSIPPKGTTRLFMVVKKGPSK